MAEVDDRSVTARELHGRLKVCFFAFADTPPDAMASSHWKVKTVYNGSMPSA
ncbi:hypothetical protein ABZ863_12095 [Saccharomonospora sp. NPDC046836]|uniref:hypothetical protein n=1 Tax=Saccharomonospora sp. NPDC046836 TaxID=3156921 RepID=UPI00340607A3